MDERFFTIEPPVNYTEALNLSSADTHTSISLVSKTALGIGLSISGVIIILGNILVITAIGINRKLRTVTNYFVLSLAVADLTLGVIVLPFSLILQLEKRWLFGKIFCNIWAAADVLCCTASILSLCAISVDRYIGVTQPLAHRVGAHCTSSHERSIPIFTELSMEILSSCPRSHINSFRELNALLSYGYWM